MGLTCSKCGKEKPKDQFYSDGKGGHKGRCIPCYIKASKGKRKTCSVCGVEKGEQSFHKDKSQKDGLRHTCTLCYNARYHPKPLDLIAQTFNLAERFKQLRTTHAEEVAVCRAIREIVEALPDTANDAPTRHTEAVTTTNRRDHQLSVIVTDAVRAIQGGHMSLEHLPESVREAKDSHEKREAA